MNTEQLHMTNPFIQKIGYENKEFARIDWYDTDGIQVHHTFCYDEEEVEIAYFNYLMHGSIYSEWHPKVVLIGKPIHKSAVSVCNPAS